jgi:hypothetical protein
MHTNNLFYLKIWQDCHFAVFLYELSLSIICNALTLALHSINRRIMNDTHNYCSFSAANTNSCFPILYVVYIILSILFRCMVEEISSCNNSEFRIVCFVKIQVKNRWCTLVFRIRTFLILVPLTPYCSSFRKKIYNKNIFFFFFVFVVWHPLVGHGLFTVEASPSLPDTLHSVGIPGLVISLSQRILPSNVQLSQETDIHAFHVGFDHSPSKKAAADPRLRNQKQYICLYSDHILYIIYTNYFLSPCLMCMW